MKTACVRLVSVCVAAGVAATAVQAAGKSVLPGMKLSLSDRAPFCGDPDRELGLRYSNAVLADIKSRERAGAPNATKAIAAMRAEYCNGHEAKK